MHKLQFSTSIHAPKEKIWSILWNDKTFRDWANNIDEGMYLTGEIKEGSEVRFVSGDSKYGVNSVIEKLTPNEFILFRHIADKVDGGKKEQENEWTGGEESYSLREHNSITTLTVILDTPPEQVENFNTRLPKVLSRIKELAEK